MNWSVTSKVMSVPKGPIHWLIRGSLQAVWQEMVLIWRFVSATNALLLERDSDIPQSPTPAQNMANCGLAVHNT